MTAAGDTRRSATETPVDVSPTISDRWMRWHALGESRLATTCAPGSSAVPSAAAKRTAVSGVRSTFTRPATPSPANRRLEARLSQTMCSCVCVPVSTSLNG